MHKNSTQYFVNMPFNISKIFSKLVLILFLMFTSLTFSQPPPPFDDDVNDELPIDSHSVVLLVLGIALGYSLLKKNKIVESISK